MIPKAPKPNSLPRMGKKRWKKDWGHPISAKMRNIVWKMIKRRLRTAQNIPAAWLGTVLFLRTRRAQVRIRQRTRSRGVRDVIVAAVGRIARAKELVDGLDVMNKSDDVTGEHEEEGNDAQHSDDVETNEDIYKASVEVSIERRS